MAQAIGLHVELDPRVKSQAPWKAEARRRVWYSLYVLDRLLSLQLGRPPAIHDDDCHVLLPSRIGDADIDWESSDTGLPLPEGPSMGDYFLAVISLSRMIGRVLRDLYNPQRAPTAAFGLSKTASLDTELLCWKGSLPRMLRFDFGHVFETSVIFRRQVTSQPSQACEISESRVLTFGFDIDT